MNDRVTLYRLLLVLGILALLIVASNIYLGGIPVLGKLPGDIELDYPGGFLYLPIMTSFLLAALIIALALAVSMNSKNEP